jgi:hypothetical protein
MYCLFYGRRRPTFLEYISRTCKNDAHTHRAGMGYTICCIQTYLPDTSLGDGNSAALALMFYVCFLHFRGKSTFPYTGWGYIFKNNSLLIYSMYCAVIMEYAKMLICFTISLQKRLQILNEKCGKQL